MKSPFDLTGKVAIVTGGGTGVGKGIATCLANAGADIVLAARRLEPIEKECAELQKLGCKTLAVQTDVTEKEQVDNLVKATVDKFGKIDILVNNAGGSGPWPFEKMSLKGWNSIMAINLTGSFLCCQAVGAVMAKQGRGKIINIGSTSGLVASGSLVHYAAAKAGVINMTASLGYIWGKYNINVNCVIPGLIATEALEASLGEFLAQAKAYPLGRLGKPEEIGGPVVFLASDASNYMTGRYIVVDGGQTLRSI
jgi:NAD(P)-dependent dehydrogenase (short-subunit alcohol dehydrogenase family)